MSSGIPKNQIKSRNTIEQAEHEDNADARRVTLVDPEGEFVGNNDSPLVVELASGSIQPELSVKISSKDDDPNPGDIHSSIRIGDQNNELKVNSDGSINVVTETINVNKQIVSSFSEALSVPGSVITTVISYTVPTGLSMCFLQRVHASGENIAKYTVFINGTQIDTRRTYYASSFDVQFEYCTGTEDGITLNANDQITLKVLHLRPYVGDFDGRIQVVQVS